MKNLKSIKKLITTSIIITFLCATVSNANNLTNEILDDTIIIESMSTDESSISTMALYPDIFDINEQAYYIKNVSTGQYLDAQGGVAENGTNVWQYKFNGSLAQKWFLHSYGDGTYSIYTPLGNDGTYRYCLDISDASGSDFANVQIWQPNGTDAQRFSIGKTNFGTYVFFTKCSNYEKAVVLQEANCTEGINVLQYSFLSSPRETWILEPVNRNVYLGLDYARTNYNQYVPTYPNLSSFEGHSADCANFVSQSLLASGVHYEGDWKVYRKNYNYKAPTTVAQLNDSWELCQPEASPWTSAKYFERYWSKRANNVEVFTIDYVLNHPDEIFQKKFYPCDVVQLAYNRLGIRAESWHTMFITNYLKYNNKDSYALTYHSGSQIDKELLRICEEYKAQGRNDYLVFFSI